MSYRTIIIIVVVALFAGFGWWFVSRQHSPQSDIITDSQSVSELVNQPITIDNSIQKGDSMSSPSALVAYFSATGTTAAAAQAIADAIAAPTWEIVPATAYTTADLDWHDKQSRSSLEMDDPNARPPLASTTDLSAYDTVIIGSPIWWGVNPRLINTFIDSHDLTGKQIYLFVTSGSSGVEDAVAALQATYPHLTIVDGLRYTNQTAEQIRQWLGR